MANISEPTTGPATDRLPVYAFDHAHDVSPRELVHVLGGKGAGLAEMTSVLRLPVPPGFTLGLGVCRTFWAEGWPAGLDDLLRDHLSSLEARMGRRFGDPADPLLLAVRSGAPQSMPGMMDTVLNIGLNDECVEGLAAVSGDPVFAWDSYRRFLEMFGATVMGVDESLLKMNDDDRELSHIRNHVATLKERITSAAGRPVPIDAFEQLRLAIQAVLESWESPRAKAFRAAEGHSDDTGTAVNIQAMVFGNRGKNSGTGVVFTRNPLDGTRVLYGDYLPEAQGEDVVAGIAHTHPLTYLADHVPSAWDELNSALAHLEEHYRDMCDVEFTVEQGRLWMLQTRAGKRGAVAAVRCAVQMVDDPAIGLTREEALLRAPKDLRDKARAEVLASAGHNRPEHVLLATGLGVSAGRVSGRVVLSSIDAAHSDGNVILVRPETSPEDVVGMAASAGILTTTGGLVSHAAVVARGWHLPAVVGAKDLRVLGKEILTPSGDRIRAGDLITIDGRTGEVWLGDATLDAAPLTPELERAAIDELLPELLILDAWAEELEQGERNVSE